jgi:hypothetical protein
MDSAIVPLDVEFVLHYARNHIFITLFFAVVAYSAFSWVVAWKNQLNFPRVYTSESNWFDRLTDKFRMVLQSEKAVFKGYKMVHSLCFRWSNLQFPKGFFQIKTFSDKYVVVDRESLKELFSASEDTLSFTDPVSESLQLRYTFQESIAVNHYHVIVTRTELSRHIPELMPDIVDELGAAFEDEISVTNGTSLLHNLTIEWMPICSFQKTVNIVARISNRVFVGLPLCTFLLFFPYLGRNKDYLHYAVEHATNVVQVGSIIRFLPEILKPYFYLSLI